MTASRYKLVVVVPSFSTYIHSNPISVAQGLMERGHEVVLVSTKAANTRQRDYPDSSSPANQELPFPVLLVPQLGVIRDNVLAFPDFRQMSNDFDAVLLQEDYPIICLEMWLWARRRNIPVIVSMERYYYPQDWFAGTSLRMLDRTVLRMMWHHALAITFHSHASLQFLHDLGAPDGKLRVIPAATDVQLFENSVAKGDRDRRDMEPGSVELLCVARLHPYKGLDTLLDAVQILVKNGVKIHLRIKGRGPAEVQLHRRISDLSLAQVVTLDTTAIPNSEMPKLMASADLYVQPSLYEPFGAAVVEAMASGLPVVASSVGGLCDTVADGETGLLVPPLDPNRLAQSISTLVSRPDYRSAMGEAGKRRASERFDYRVVAKDYEQLLREVLS